ncbi:sugar phosphate isomerase/epimerase [Candidatus Gracilibacteria bacterium]|nr:sugar phosphate isomerase/epimerase [Candidatus Gracilibacteria bacterium]
MLLFHSSNLPHYGLERVFEFTKSAGYDGIEIGVSLNFDTQNPKYLKKLSDRYDLPIKAFSLSEKHEESLTQAFQKTVREFPETIITLNPPQVLSFEYKKWLNKIVPKLAQKYDLIFCRKNVPSKSVMGFLPARSDNSIYVLKEKGYVALDLTALASSNEDIMHSIRVLGNHLKHVYLSNVARNELYSLPQSGILPIESFLTKLAQKKYRGTFSVKVSPKQLLEGEEDKVVEKMIEVRKFYEKYFVKD